MALTKTQAIKTARGYVSTPIRCDDRAYVVCGPWDDNKPNGPSTEYQANNYFRARTVRTRWVARVALALLGLLDGDAMHFVDNSLETTIEGIVNAYLETKHARV